MRRVEGAKAELVESVGVDKWCGLPVVRVLRVELPDDKCRFGRIACGYAVKDSFGRVLLMKMTRPNCGKAVIRRPTTFRSSLHAATL